MKSLEGKISGSLDSRGTLRIEIEDEASRIVIVRALMDGALLASLLSGRQGLECKFEMPPLDLLENVGKYFEVESMLTSTAEKEVLQEIAGRRIHVGRSASNEEIVKAERKRVELNEEAKDVLMAIAENQGFLEIDGWGINSTGIGSQQNGKGWGYSISRYTDEPNEFTKSQNRFKP